MTRIILLAALVWVVYIILKRLIATPSTPQNKNAIEDIVQCAFCGVYSPKSESFLAESSTGEQAPKEQQYFCCEDHRKRKIKEEQAHK